MEENTNKLQQGILFVLSGPSGVGKGTVLEKLFEEYDDVKYSVSVTTRELRQGEVNGENYFFLSEKEFFKMRDGNRFIESAKVHNHYYGTPKNEVERSLRNGEDIILEIDIQGAKQVKKLYPEAIFIFLMPPSLGELKNRLEKRGSEDKYNQSIRLKNAEDELKEKNIYDYKIINDNLSETVKKLKDIIISEKKRRDDI